MASERTATEAAPIGIAVFGSSDPRPGETLYETAYGLGKLLARQHYLVITGGYGGVMEGASRGAREAGGPTLGVTCETLAARAPNAYLTQQVATDDLFARTRELIDRASGFAVLPGKAGTLAELAWLWALDRAGCLGRRPVVLLGSGWQALVDLLEQGDMLEPSQIRRTRFASSPADAVALLGELLSDRGGQGA